ncbi:Uncharacterized GPI-anchored protein At3g06035 [Linum perenne]
MLVYKLIRIERNSYVADDENNLLQGLNSYRQSQSLPILAKHDKAGCVADRVANKLENQPCPASGRAAAPVVQLSDYPEVMDKCGVDINKTREGLGSEDDWMVVVLTTASPGGSFAGANRLVGVGGRVGWLVSILVGVLVWLVA